MASPRLALATLLALGAPPGCAPSNGGDVDSGAGGRAGAVDAGTDGGAGAVSAASGLPVPPGAPNVPKPSGTPRNLTILDWAGFKSALSWTFDDGQPSQIQHYAELQATGVRMTFNVSSGGTWATGFTDTFKQAVLDGHEIGNHTVHHCNADPDGTLYSNDSSGTRIACAGTLASEYDDCTEFITSTLGAANVWTTASPFGAAGYKTAAAARFFLNRGVRGGTIAPNDGSDFFDLPTWGPTENDGVDTFNAQVDGAHLAGRWLIMLLHSIGPTADRWYATVDISAITGSIGHASSLGDIWQDSMANVGAYWRGQRLLLGVTPTTSGDTQTWTWTLPDHFPTGKYLRVKVDGGTLSQNGTALTWDAHGFYEIALDAGSLTLAP